MKAGSRNTIRIAVIALAVSLIILGIARKEAGVVLSKARAICYACIGLS